MQYVHSSTVHLLQEAKAAKEEEAGKVAALQKQLEEFQEEQKLRQARETEVQALKAQLEELQAKEAAEEEPKAHAAAAAAAAAAVTASPAGSPSGKKKSSGKYKEEIERLRARISQMKMEAIGDYEYMMMQVRISHIQSEGMSNS